MSCRHHRLRRSAELSLLATSSLPVAGIAAPEAGAILHAVRRAFATREPRPRPPPAEEGCDLLLLAALSCAQEASDRLLADLDAAQRAAGFWRARMRAGGHDAFMLLGRGPVHFATGVFASFGGGLGGGLLGGLGGGGGGKKGGRRQQSAEGEEDDADQEQPQWSATDRIQERIDALEALSRRLAAAVAGVHRAADLLRLNAPAGTRGTTAAAAAAAAAPASAAMQPAAPLAASDPDAAERAVALSARRLRAAIEDVPLAAAEAAERGERGDEEEEEEDDSEGGDDAFIPATADARAGDDAGGPLAAARADLAAVVAVLDGCPLCDGGRRRRRSNDPPQTTTTPTTAAAAALLETRLPASRDASDALRRAASGALSRGALAPVPPWAAMPSRLQRHWLRYAAAGAAAVALAAWARRHSRLAGGSGDLERWAAETGASLSSAWRAHVIDPLAAVRRELFATLRDRPAIVSQAEFAGDREALLRMLRAFEGDYQGGGGQGEGLPEAGAGAPAELSAAAATAAAPGAAVAAAPSAPSPPPSSPDATTSPPPLSDDRALLMSRGMARVMESYELELRRPLRNLFAGSLARCLLIQVQRLKVDTEAAMLEMDQILRANELSLTLVAAVPSLAVAALAARGAYRLLLVRAPPDPKREAVPCRMAMGALERALGAAGAAARAAEAEKEEEEEEEEVGGAGAAAAAAAPALGPSPSPSPRRPPRVPPPILPAHPVPKEELRVEPSNTDADLDADASNARAVAVAEGGAVHALHSVFQEASRLYLLRRGASRREWPYLREGLVQMARPPLSAEGKVEYHRHLTRTYALFQA